MKILVATDGSPSSTNALAAALRLLPMREAEVTVVAVTPMVGLEPLAGIGPYPAVGPAPFPDEADTRLHLEAARTALEAAGVHPVLIAKDGDPATRIVEAAEAVHADIVVLGSHGRGAFGRLMLGSVSDAVAHRWPGATLIVPHHAA